MHRNNNYVATFLQLVRIQSVVALNFQGNTVCSLLQMQIQRICLMLSAILIHLVRTTLVLSLRIYAALISKMELIRIVVVVFAFVGK